MSLIFLLLAAVFFFEALPVIEDLRYRVPGAVYAGKECDCACISDSRPWYSTFNYWKWFWIAIAPLTVFSMTPSASRRQKITIAVLLSAFCYLSMNLAVNLFWDIRNGPFRGLDFSFTAGKGCADIRDGASLGFTLLLGWIPAGLYVAFWWAVWRGVASLSKTRN